MVMDMTMLMYLVLAEQICSTAAAELLLLVIIPAAAKQVQDLATANTYNDTVSI